MGDYTFSLSLWFEHSEADLSEVPQKLGIQASRMWKKGDRITTPTDRVMDGTYKKSYCSIQLGQRRQEDLSAGLRSALVVLLPHRAYFEKLSADGIQVRFFIGWFSDKLNSREIVDWEILRDMAQLHISLDLDFYGPDKAEE
jgi:hypothetical protein